MSAFQQLKERRLGRQGPFVSRGNGPRSQVVVKQLMEVLDRKEENDAGPSTSPGRSGGSKASMSSHSDTVMGTSDRENEFFQAASRGIHIEQRRGRGRGVFASRAFKPGMRYHSRIMSKQLMRRGNYLLCHFATTSLRTIQAEFDDSLFSVLSVSEGWSNTTKEGGRSAQTMFSLSSYPLLLDREFLKRVYSIYSDARPARGMTGHTISPNAQRFSYCGNGTKRSFRIRRLEVWISYRMSRSEHWDGCCGRRRGQRRLGWLVLR